MAKGNVYCVGDNILCIVGDIGVTLRTWLGPFKIGHVVVPLRIIKKICGRPNENEKIPLNIDDSFYRLRHMIVRLNELSHFPCRG